MAISVPAAVLFLSFSLSVSIAFLSLFHTFTLQSTYSHTLSHTHTFTLQYTQEVQRPAESFAGNEDLLKQNERRGKPIDPDSKNAKRNKARRARRAAKKAGQEVGRLVDPVNTLRREKRQAQKQQARVRQAVGLVALQHNMTFEELVRSNISPMTTPSLHQAIKGNQVNTAIAASVGGYVIDTLSFYGNTSTV